MSVDLPPQSVEQCVIVAEQAPKEKGAIFLMVAGAPQKVDNFLVAHINHGTWTLVGQGSGDGVATAVLRGDLQMPYRELGGAIFEAQSMSLAANLVSYPSVCEPATNMTQSQADGISEKCGAPPGTLTIQTGELRFEPVKDLGYDVSACILNAIKESGVSKFGFVGNDKDPDDAGN